MKLLKELSVEGGVETITIEFTEVTAPLLDHVKVFVSGNLAAQTGDRRFLLRVNGRDSGYKSFVIIGGHAVAVEWDESGFYVGRNGSSLDASVSIEYTISSCMLNQKRVGHGMATFAHGNDTIFGYTCNGFLVSDQPIRSVSIIVTGGLFTGKIKAYSF